MSCRLSGIMPVRRMLRIRNICIMRVFCNGLLGFCCAFFCFLPSIAADFLSFVPGFFRAFLCSFPGIAGLLRYGIAGFGRSFFSGIPSVAADFLGLVPGLCCSFFCSFPSFAGRFFGRFPGVWRWPLWSFPRGCRYRWLYFLTFLNSPCCINV